MKKTGLFYGLFLKLMICVAFAVALAACGGTGEGSKEKNREESIVSTEPESNKTEPESNKTEQESNKTEPESSGKAVTLRIGALKGPTTMGLLFLMEDQKEGKASGDYEFQMATGADELLPLMVSGKLDVALVPANVAAILYQKTQGAVAVVDVNVLGVLYLVSNDETVKGFEDLKGRSVYLTGKGTTPDYVLQYLLRGAGFAEGDVTLEYKSEAAEVAALLAKQEGAVGFLPQPFVTAACMQNERLQIVASANEAWKELQGGEDPKGLVTGVTVVRREILDRYPDAVKTFLEEHEKSVRKLEEDLETGAKLAVEAGIVGKEPIAVKAIPYCNVTCLTGEEMKAALQAYLEILSGFDPSSVGGKLPGEDFYYVP